MAHPTRLWGAAGPENESAGSLRIHGLSRGAFSGTAEGTPPGVDAAGVKTAHMKLLKSVAAGRGPDGLRASLQLKMVVEGDAERAVPGRPRCRTASTDRQGVRGLEMTLLRGAAGTHGRTTRNLIPHRSPMCRHAWPIRRDCEDAPLSATHGAQGHSAFGRHPRERSPRQPSALRSPPRRERRGDGTVAIRRVL